MQITLEIKETIFDKFIWMLEHFDDDIQIVEDSEGINVDTCLDTMHKVKTKKSTDFEVIEDIDAHIKELVDATR